jgi:hypothetical protein
MRRQLIGLVAMICVACGITATASATALKGVGPSSGNQPRACKRVAYTADGGYYSAGHFYREPGYDVTLITKWCYSNGIVKSYSVTYTTTIPDSLGPQLSTNESLINGGATLDVGVNGTYNSNVINNTGLISIVGHVTGRGRHHFVNASGAGG